MPPDLLNTALHETSRHSTTHHGITLHTTTLHKPRNAQVALLAYQSTLETLAVASQASAIERISRVVDARPRLETLAPEAVLSAVQAIKQ